jgi:hypothetical protein
MWGVGGKFIDGVLAKRPTCLNRPVSPLIVTLSRASALWPRYTQRAGARVNGAGTVSQEQERDACGRTSETDLCHDVCFSGVLNKAKVTWQSFYSKRPGGCLVRVHGHDSGYICGGKLAVFASVSHALMQQVFSPAYLQVEDDLYFQFLGWRTSNILNGGTGHF